MQATAEGPDTPRVLSLLSAATEIVHRLGCGHLLVGRSHGCDDPPLATVKPIATAPKVDPNSSSLELDEAVRVQSASGGPVYHIFNERLINLRPTVIITQEQCRICAVTPADVRDACAALPTKAVLITIKPTTLEDVFDDVQTIARALGVAQRGDKLVSYMKRRLADVARMCQAETKLAASKASIDGIRRPRVAHLEWLAPVMGSGYWIAECVHAAGCDLVHGHSGGHSQTIDDISTLANAEILLLAPCGFSLERTHAELSSCIQYRGVPLLQCDAWKALPAVQSGAVFVADGNLFFNRSSVSGVVLASEIVAEMVWGDMCGMFGHHGRHWVRLSELDAFCAREGAPSATKPVQLASASPLPAKVGANFGDSPVKKRFKAGTDSAASPSAHVQQQVDALCEGNFATAFALNSKANQTRLGNAAKFEAIVRGSPSFSALIDPNIAVRVSSESDADAAMLRQNGRSIAVSVIASSEGAAPVAFAFDLSWDGGDKGCWVTDGVRIEC